MRASRLVSLLILLQMRGRMPAARIAEMFEVSTRTIYRDVDALSAAGIPIYADPGRDGGIALHDGYRTRLTGFSDAEAQALPLAGSPLADDLGLGAEAFAARLKLAAALPPDRSAQAERMAQRIHLDPLPWYHHAEPLAGLSALADAVWRERRARIDYEGWNRRTDRVVDPLGLAQKGGLWYLIARTGKAIRTYRVSSIVTLDVLDEPFERPSRFDLARHWAGEVQRFEAALAACPATLRISPEGRRILRATLPNVDAQIGVTSRPSEPPGWVEADVRLELPETSALQLLALDAEVEVLAPAELRAEVTRQTQRVMALYRP